MQITFTMARKRLQKSLPVYVEFYEIADRRERVTKLSDHGDEVTLTFFCGTLRLAKNRVRFFY